MTIHMGEGGQANLSRVGTELLLDLFPFLAVTQEMISATIVALHLLPSSSLGLLATRA